MCDVIKNEEDKILLEETFYVLSKKHSVFRVRLTKLGLTLIKENDNNVKETVIPIQDIIGSRCLRSKKQGPSCSCNSLPRTSINVVDANSGEQDDSDISTYLYIYAYVMHYNKGIPIKRERTIITLRFKSFDKFEDNNKEAQRWRMILKQLINGEHVNRIPMHEFKIVQMPKENRKLLVLCNPKSGPGKSRNIFLERIVPMLQEAEIPYDLYITKYANYAREFIRTSNIYQWTMIVLVGGDGIIYEAINGIFERFDWAEVLRHIPLGVVPGGSGNGLARSIAYAVGEPYTTDTVLPSALSLVKRNCMPLDLVRVETTSEIIFSFLSVGWGFLSDVDIESERLRMLGGQRFVIWSVARLIGLKSYGGKVWYLPATHTSPSKKRPIFGRKENIELPLEITFESQTSDRPRLDSWYSAASKRSAYFSTTAYSAAGGSFQSVVDLGPTVDGSGSMSPTTDGISKTHRMYGPASQLPCVTAPLTVSTNSDYGWQCIEGRFVMVHASYVSHIGEDCLIAPDAKLDDGCIWLLIISDRTTRAQLFNFLFRLNNGTHLQNQQQQENGSIGTEEDSIRMLPVYAFRIEPDMNESGYITVDGEHVNYGPIQAEVYPSLARVAVP